MWTVSNPESMNTNVQLSGADLILTSYNGKVASWVETLGKRNKGENIVTPSN